MRMIGDAPKIRFAMAFRTSSTAISLTAFLLLALALPAQTTKTVTLNEILDRMEANLDNHDAHLPSLFCDEHVISSRFEYGSPDQTTVTDSVFRLKRTRKSDHTTTFVESREIRRLDGKPATSQHIDGPALLSGAFEGGLAVVSRDQAACMNYTLQPIDSSSRTEHYTLRFATALGPRNSASCFLQEESKGRALIDPASMQVTHLEITTPRHVIVKRKPFTSDITGNRTLTIDYAPVLLGGETFWMPSAITMRTTSGFGFHRTVWLFRAAYRNYHRLEVTSRILPSNEIPKP